MQLIDVKAGRILPTTSVVNIYKSVILCVLGYLSHLCGVPIFSWLKVANHPNGRSPPFLFDPAGGPWRAGKKFQGKLRVMRDMVKYLKLGQRLY